MVRKSGQLIHIQKSEKKGKDGLSKEEGQFMIEKNKEAEKNEPLYLSCKFDRKNL